MPEKTSIIMNAYIKSPMVAQMTMASLANIRRYTGQPYELIVVDNEPLFPIRDEYKVLKIDKYIKNEKDIGCYASYNLGVSQADPDSKYFVFIQNDVFVFEGWMEGLRKYLENNLADVVFPDQVPRDREYVLNSYNLAWDSVEAMKGSRDAGLMMMTRRAFEIVGGWPEGLKTAIIAEKHMYDRIGRAGLRWADTNKVMITHIMAATNLIRLHENPQDYNDSVDKEEKYANQ